MNKKEMDKLNRKTQKRIEESMKFATEEIKRSVDVALKSGALSETSEFFDDNYLFAKALITAYFDRKPFGMITPKLQRELKNLERFL